MRLPDLEQSKSAVLNSLASQSSQRSYDHAIREFIDWYCSEPRLAFNKTVVTRYRIFLEQARITPRRPSTFGSPPFAASRMKPRMPALLSPDLAAGIRRVKGVKKLGRSDRAIGSRPNRGGACLRCSIGKRCAASRDYAMAAVLLGCGLRRAELAALAVAGSAATRRALGHLLIS